MGAIRLRFYEGVGLYAWLTRMRTWGKYTHVDIVLPSGLLLGAIIGEGVTRHTTHKAKAYITYDIPVPEPERALAWVKRQIGKPYDLGAILGFMSRRNWSDDEKWFCSELAAQTLIVAGLPPLISADPFMVSPRALLFAISWAGAREVQDE